ncbi:MAG: HEAT repeat domain-containing protein [Gemmatimonadota bacterium]
MRARPTHAALLLLVLLAAPLAAQDADVRRLGRELLSAPSPSFRCEAARALGRAGTPMGVRVLHAALPQERDQAVRLEILRALRAIAFQRYPGYREALAAIAYAADDAVERDELVRLRATEALWEAGKKDLLDPVPVLSRQLTDTSQRLRLSAVEMLRKLSTPEAAEVLGRTAVDKTQSETVRLAAIEALGAVALSEGGPVGRSVDGANIAAAREFPITPLVSSRALERRHERQIQYLAAVARDQDSSPTLVLRAVKSMGQVKDHSSVPVLRELLATHPHAGVRLQATRVLSHVLARQYE